MRTEYRSASISSDQLNTSSFFFGVPETRFGPRRGDLVGVVGASGARLGDSKIGVRVGIGVMTFLAMAAVSGRTGGSLVLRWVCSTKDCARRGTNPVEDPVAAECPVVAVVTMLKQHAPRPLTGALKDGSARAEAEGMEEPLLLALTELPVADKSGTG